MRKMMLTLLMVFVLIFGYAQFPHPALVYTRTGQAEPVFISITLPTVITPEDWVGCYDDTLMLCYGSFKADKRVHYVAAFIDENMTEKKDGFDYGDIISLFYYKASTKEFFKLTGDYYNTATEKVITELRVFPLALYRVTNVQIGGPIQLNTDPDLASVELCFDEHDYTIKTGGISGIPLKYRAKNVSGLQMFISSGSGKIVKGKYEFTSTDNYVIINLVGKSDFSDEMLADQTRITLDQSIESNKIFGDDNVVFYLKGDEVCGKVLAEKISLRLYRYDNGVEKRTFTLSSKKAGYEQVIFKPYSRSWKGLMFRIEYWYYIDGKMVNKVPIEHTFIL